MSPVSFLILVICTFSFCSFLLPKAPQYIVVYSSCERLWLCYVGHNLSMAWWAVLGPCPGSKPAKPWATEAEHANLTTRPWGQLPDFLWQSKWPKRTKETSVENRLEEMYPAKYCWLFYKLIAMKTMQFWCRERKQDCWNIVNSPEI